MRPFNIDARLNGAYVALGLLYGSGDFAKTLDVSTRAGQDSDCNPSSAAGILGVMLGYAKIPDEWKSGIPALAGTQVRVHELLVQRDRRVNAQARGEGRAAVGRTGDRATG